MNDSQLTRYAFLEPQLPEPFPRLADHGISYMDTGGAAEGWCGAADDWITDLERLGLAVLVLRAGRKDFNVHLVSHCELGMKDPDFTEIAIDHLLTALEAAYPEGSGP